MLTDFQGRFLLCRVILKADRKIGVDFVVEDPMGTAIVVAVYNYPSLLQALRPALDAIFPVGQVLMIREPWVKSPTSGPSMIRVDNPSDVIAVHGGHPIARQASWHSTLPRNPFDQESALRLKALGAEHYKAGRWIAAARLWTLAIQKSSLSPELLLNRAQAYISLRWFVAALKDSEVVLAEFPTSALRKKAIYRAASAEYGLGRYEVALERFKLLDATDAANWTAKCQQRLQEASTGQYDWLSMYQTGQAKIPFVDVAEFVGPVEITAITGRGGGRGVVATRNIKCGELLVVAKPFGSIFSEELAKGETINVFNFLTGKYDDTSHIGLVYRVIDRLYGCPERVNQLYDLYGGKEYRHSSGAYSPLLRSDLELTTPFATPVDINSTRISGIVSFNVFCPHGLGPARLPGSPSKPEDDLGHRSAAALYTLPSLFNHACNPNAHWTTFGDVLVIRALNDITKGMEITVPYVTAISVTQRTKFLLALLEGRPCDCSLCVADRADNVRAPGKRDALYSDLVQNSNFGSIDAGRAEKMIDQHIKEIASTYSADRTLRFEQSMLHIAAYQNLQRLSSSPAIGTNADSAITRAIKHGFEALSTAGFCDVDTGIGNGLNETRKKLPLSQTAVCPKTVEPEVHIGAMLYLSHMFIKLGNIVRAERWLRAAWWGKCLFTFRLFGILV
ncbi:hypothetical protein DL93DRAFT_2063996 [Clavulina sp. PMI_390]|nr:hypothetical protein DL93DRAFT_2063996 [Clavulina sp. PMI_390]